MHISVTFLLSLCFISIRFISLQSRPEREAPSFPAKQTQEKKKQEKKNNNNKTKNIEDKKQQKFNKEKRKKKKKTRFDFAFF